MKYFLTLLYICSLSSYAFSPQVFKEASFKQTRYIKSSSIELFSSGILSAKAGEFVWHQKTPFEFKNIFKDGKLYRIVNNKRVEENNPIALQVAKMMTQILKGQGNNISEVFSISETEKNAQVKLTPKDPMLKKVIEKIEILQKNILKNLNSMRLRAILWRCLFLAIKIN